MKISTKGRYGLRAMIDLAIHEGPTPILMDDIAHRQNISKKYLHALLTSLKTAGLIRSVRGAGGGYILTRKPDAIDLAEILKALEGSLALVECTENSSVCDKSGSCTAQDLWCELSRDFENRLKEVKLSDLVKRAVEHENDTLMFNI